MILVAVGTQFPFDRMISSIDEWALSRGCNDIVAQIGSTNYKCRAIQAMPYIEAAEFLKLQRRAKLLIGHAGMGTILGALELGKPLIIMPRLARFGEHRNDHQLDTVARFRGKSGIYVADDESVLVDLLNRRDQLFADQAPISPSASPELIQAVKNFISFV